MTKIAIVTVSDRASRGEYEDLGGPAIECWLRRALATPCDFVRRVIPDGLESVRDVLVELCDRRGVDLVLTTGGTGPSPRDLTPEAMQQVITKELLGFGELMRQASLQQARTAILSRQTAGVRGRSLIINLPGKPASIDVCLNAVFPAVPYCLELIGAAPIIPDPAIFG
ncbi:molybdopterin adenylyltransferase (plasmid) [Mesorhizobium sp. B2-1-8]|uniref:molybdopterin adenylyltransferase n=1 Tax=Mesorhizobium sp. B2-1-8 TaxID=2589967 RepID=UPI001125BFBD|nr:molybdopterin adenylyltransferase [Mesorhizobium sp. B2-1-8]UCI23040.1 molybdopterin adenylyltransferase [Mesorhizobium sp. B2-1-8]